VHGCDVRYHVPPGARRNRSHVTLSDRHMPSALRTLTVFAAMALIACSDDESVELSDSLAVKADASAPSGGSAGTMTQAADAAPTVELPASVVAEASDVQSPEFLSLFVAPADTVRLTNTTSIRLWDLIGVADSPKGDPRKRIPTGAATWAQVGGPTITLTNPTSPDAAAAIPASAMGQPLTFRINITNASGGRSMDVNVVVLKK